MAAQYVFTVFTSASESNMNVYTSTDATNFALLKLDAYVRIAFLFSYKTAVPSVDDLIDVSLQTPTNGLLRDPSVTLHGQNFFIAYTTGWEGRTFALAKSSNLVDWTLHTTITTPDTLITRTWAPEFFKDPRTGKTHIIVSLGGTLSDFEAYLYTATDDTLLSWSGPVLMDGIGPNYIDTFVIYRAEASGGYKYHAFSKNESAKYIEHATAKSLAGPWTFEQTGKFLYYSSVKPPGNGIDIRTGNFASWGRAEGPCITTIGSVAGGDFKYRLFADGYDSGKYIYSDSTDLYTWSAFNEVPNGLSGYIRHGTVLGLS